jgi:hypothetical protein
MKTIFTLMLLALFAVGINAQYQLPADFETPMEDTVWAQFANGADAEENMMLAENPAMDGINTSANCLKYIVLPTADPWAGAWAEAYGPFVITAENYMLQMMVHKDVTSNSGLKLEAGDADNVEVMIPNTVTGEWELLTFDFTAAIGATYARLVVFPDFPDPRTAGSTCYIDNIGWVGGGTTVGSNQLAEVSIYPNPATDRISVRYPDMGSMTISNVVGQSVLTFEFKSTNSEVIEISELEPGLYFINLETSGGMVSSKFIKE